MDPGDGEHAEHGEEVSRTPDMEHKTTHGIQASPDETPHARKRRRKVNHACVYCRRSHMTCDLERPCTRCIKRNIGHLCRDEPREHDNRKAKLSGGGSGGLLEEEHASAELPVSLVDVKAVPAQTQPQPQQQQQPFGGPELLTDNLGRKNDFLQQFVEPSNGLIGALEPNGGNMNQFTGLADVWMTAQNHLQDESSYDSNYMINPDVGNEYQLLNEFLHSSLVDDGAFAPEGQDRNLLESKHETKAGLVGQTTDMLPPSAISGGVAGSIPKVTLSQSTVARTKPALPEDKRREYYLQAADPSGNDTPEERMQRVLKAKQDAGLLKPFNYIQGYRRLGKYLESHIAQASKHKVLRQINQFRPKFRDKMQALTDIELIYVEMWFEKTLMEYDRVFSSMAVPACCWRRTGEIFRGNREMAELIHVPVEKLREGKISLHEILTEESVVRYWEEFGTIAFDPAHDTLLTACTVKNPDDNSKHPITKCCFSIKIRRDDHKIPSLIVGNFLPHDPPPM